MCDENLPLGWNNRHNATVIPAGNALGDWKPYTAIEKYCSSSKSDENSDLPFGWEDRMNTKTIEELSLSKDSTNVCVAEVNLADKNRDNDNEVSGYPNSSALLRLQKQVEKLENNVEKILKQQEMIISLLIQQSNAKIDSSNN